ncbi:unnamed protein product, partial [Meganyctiphanes norvegica]
YKHAGGISTLLVFFLLLMMKVLAVLLLAGVALARVPHNTRAVETTRVFTDANMNGNYLDINDYVPDLGQYNFDNSIDSACVTGIWLYYENTEYNKMAGRVYWLHGIDFCGNFPNDYTDMISSVRFAGDPTNWQADTLTVYEGQYFTGNEFYCTSDCGSLGNLDLDASSLIVTGTSPWTVYDGTNYSGQAICVYPNETDNGQNGNSFSFGMWPETSTLGAPDNTIRSARKGCWA